MNPQVVQFHLGEKLEKPVSLNLIRTSQNPRQSLRGVLELFHEKGAYTNSPESRAEFVAHIDANFPFVRQRAQSLLQHGQLQAVTLRRYNSSEGDRYGIVQGECRILAWGLIEAETGVEQKVRAVIAPKMTLDEAFERGLAENIEREDMSPMDIAASFHEMLTVRINPATTKEKLPSGEPNPLYSADAPKGRPYTIKEIAEKFHRDYHWVRNREALVYLSDKDKAQVNANFAAGKRDLTRYCKKACEAKTLSLKGSGVPTGNEENAENDLAAPSNPDIVTVQPERRRRVKGLKEVVAMFDATPLANRERLQALAEVMGLSDSPAEALKLALAEREGRAVEMELKLGRQADVESRRGRKTA